MGIRDTVETHGRASLQKAVCLHNPATRHFFTIFRWYSRPSAPVTRNTYTPAGTFRIFIGELGELGEYMIRPWRSYRVMLAISAPERSM